MNGQKQKQNKNVKEKLEKEEKLAYLRINEDAKEITINSILSSSRMQELFPDYTIIQLDEDS